MNDLLIGNRGIDSEIGFVGEKRRKRTTIEKPLFNSTNCRRLASNSAINSRHCSISYGTMQVSVYINWANKPGST